MVIAPAGAQAPQQTAETTADKPEQSAMPRLADGHPNLQGIWHNEVGAAALKKQDPSATITALEFRFRIHICRSHKRSRTTGSRTISTAIPRRTAIFPACRGKSSSPRGFFHSKLFRTRNTW